MVNCKQCGKEFKRKFKREIFCSVKCYAESRTEPSVKITCPVCGEVFYKKKYHIKKGVTHFCSRSCSSKSRKKYFEETRACLYCGEKFTVLSRSKKKCCCCDCAAKHRSIVKKEKELKELEREFNKLYEKYVTKLEEY